MLHFTHNTLEEISFKLGMYPQIDQLLTFAPMHQFPKPGAFLIVDEPQVDQGAGAGTDSQ